MPTWEIAAFEVGLGGKHMCVPHCKLQLQLSELNQRAHGQSPCATLIAKQEHQIQKHMNVGIGLKSMPKDVHIWSSPKAKRRSQFHPLIKSLLHEVLFPAIQASAKNIDAFHYVSDKQKMGFANHVAPEIEPLFIIVNAPLQVLYHTKGKSKKV